MLKQLHWFAFIVSFLFPCSSWAQKPMPDQMKRFEHAKKLLSGFSVDSALVVLTKLLEELEASNELETPFGLEVQFKQAAGYEYDQKDSLAFVKLHHINERSYAKENWGVYANSCLILARLYERVGLDSTCLSYLRRTDGMLIKYVELDSLYPLFCIRSSSYHRLFAKADSALYYAKEALRSAVIHNKLEERAVGHMLMGMLLHGKNTPERLNHWRQAAKYFYKVRDYTGYGYMVGSIGGWYYQNELYDQALVYNDSSLALAHQAKLNGYDQHYLLTNQYKYRSSIYRKLGQIDSAMHYMEQGYRNELSHVYQSNNQKIHELNALYKGKKREQKINEQAELLTNEQERKYWLVGLALLALLFGAVLANYAQRLGKANDDLSVSLNQQMVMQGELHHRVKNNLQVIISLLDLQKEDVEDPIARSSMEGMANRIYSMAAIHEILYQKEGADMVNFNDYTENMCKYFGNLSLAKDRPDFSLNIINQSFNLETLMPLGIVLNELLTNSLKYAIVSDQQLEINISLEQLDDSFLIRYQDNGPGFSKGKMKEREGGLGSYLLRSMARQLKGSIETRNENGALIEFFFQVKNS